MPKLPLEKRTKIIALLPLVIFFGAIVLIALAAPILEEMQLRISMKLYALLRKGCHQLPTRCFWIYQRPLGLCGRCFGLYLGIFLTGIFLMKSRFELKKFRFTLYLILPFIVEPLMEMIDAWKGSNFIRFLTGIMAGIGVTFLYLEGIKRIRSFLAGRKRDH